MAPAFDALISRLWCLHWHGGRAPEDSIAGLRAAGVVLETCLRQLAFGIAPRPALETGANGELSTGAPAYRLLLEVTSGLRSAVPGETNVFAQFRRAWEQSAQHLRPEDHWHLQPVVHALQADTRALRASHLQGIAGGSYGSLVRELLDLRNDARVLFVGTGELARSMLPLFRAWETAAWNRRAPDQHARDRLTSVQRWFASDEADAAAAWATDLVFTTPADAGHDALWRARLSREAPRRLVHLGRRRNDPLTWPTASASFDLDDVFALAGAREQVRHRQLAEAGSACAALVAARVAGPAGSTSRSPRPTTLPRLATA